MATMCNVPGLYRGQIVKYALKQTRSGAVSIDILAKITEMAKEGEWVPFEGEDDCFVEGNVWIYKKNGELLSEAVQLFAEATGWDSELESLVLGEFKPRACQFDVRKDDYNKEERYRIGYTYPYDRAIGGDSITTLEGLKKLRDRLNAKLASDKEKKLPDTIPSGIPGMVSESPSSESVSEKGDGQKETLADLLRSSGLGEGPDDDPVPF